jgi:long-chain acyl-CoA synthetase
MPLNTLLERHAAVKPHQLALVFENTRLTTAELNEHVNRLAHALHGLGLRKGDTMAVFLDNCPELFALYHAAAKTGIVIVPLSPMLRGDGLVSLVGDAASGALVTSATLAPYVEEVRARLPVREHAYVAVDGELPGYVSYQTLLAEAPTDPVRVELRPEDPFNIIYSSGTTGVPKGIVHTHSVREAYCTGLAAAFRFHPESVALHAGSLVFNGAFLTLAPSIYLGCTYVLMSHFDPQAMVAALASERVTHVACVPSQLLALLEQPQFDETHLPSLECVISVGAPLLLEHKQELARRIPRRMYELYGLTEGFWTILDRDDFDRKMESVGVPPPLYELRIVGENGADVPRGSVGEIVGRGPTLMPGYHERPELTADAIRDGWLYTGDLGRIDDDGFLHLVDRKKDMLISGGVNVYPRDIEEVLVRHPDVVDAAVFGAPDERWGEAPVAAVRLRDGAQASADGLREWVNERVQARYQKVREVLVVADFPRSVAGKTLRRELRARYVQEQAPV